MNRQKLKGMIRNHMEVKLFKEANNIPDDEPENDENPEDKPKSADDFTGDEPKDGPELKPDANLGDNPIPPTGGPTSPEIPPSEPEPEPPKEPLVPPDYPAKDSEKVYVPGPQIPYIPQDQSDSGGEVIPAKDIPPPVSLTTPPNDYQNNPDIDVPQGAPEISREVTRRDAANLIRASKGKIFTVVFTKRGDGSERVLNGRLGVKRYLKGGSLPFDPFEKGLIPVYDIQKKDYRMIPIDSMKYLKIGGQLYKTI
jgi:hypothetical protein